MREIKFRFWYKQQKIMRIPYSLSDILLCRDCSTLKADDENTIPLQYTGLKDKNGTEIYEGDIINADDCNGEYWYKNKQVRFENAEFGIGKKATLGLKHLKNIEVLGSIYENPELLNQ